MSWRAGQRLGILAAVDVAGIAGSTGHLTDALSKPPRLIEWTGERCVPWAPDYQMVYEHVHRYHFAASFCNGKRVLDLASGEGYGSAILAQVAESVVGVEIDEATFEHAQLNYPLSNLTFVQGSMLDPNVVAEDSVDVIVCFEAIEHVAEHDQLLEVIGRALRPGGLLIISTPDCMVYTEAADYHNPFHVHELSRDEFKSLLAQDFSNVTMLGQQVISGSMIQSLQAPSVGVSDLVQVSGNDPNWERHQPESPPYLIALASNSPLPAVPVLSNLIDTDRVLIGRLATAESDTLRRERDILATQHVELADELQHDREVLTTQNQALRDEVIRLEAQHHVHDAQIGRLEISIRELVAISNEADQIHVDQAANQQWEAANQQWEADRQQMVWELNAIQSSKGWRFVLGVRRVLHRAKRFARIGRRGGSQQTA